MSREMKDSGFSWIGKVPNSWKVVPVKVAFSEIKTKNTDGVITNALKFKFGEIVPKANFDSETDDYVADTILNYTIVEPRTIMINGLNLNYDFKTLRTGLVKEKGIITSAYLALKPDENMICAKYATYLFKGYETKMAFHNMGSGIRLTLGFKEFKNQPLLLPTLQEQKKIAEFLDHQCAEIDAVIAKTKATIEEYKKLKQSIITEAVTKGIRGNRPMKDSGVEWIGHIPAHWNVIALKFLCSMQSGKNLSAEQIADEGKYPVYGGNGIRGYFSEFNTSGDLLLVGRQGALCGNVHRVSGDFWATEHAVVTKCSNYAYRDFLYYLLIGMNLNQYASNTAAQPGLSVGEIANIRTCLVPLDEQKEIADYLDKKCADIDTLIANKTTLLEEMESYKKSVIYEYVTGKKEVPNG